MYKFFRSLNYSYFFWFFFYLFIFCLLLRNSFSYLDSDFGWHLKVGQEIVKTGILPQANNFNYTYTGEWVDHEWLSNLIIFLIYEKSSYIILSIIFSFLLIVTFVVLNIFVRVAQINYSILLICLFQIFGVLASLPHFGVRIQEIALLFLLLLLLILYFYNRYKYLYILLLIPVLIYVWACLHASFLIALGLLVVWLFIKIIENILYIYCNKSWLDFSNRLLAKDIIICFFIFILSFLVTFITPYKFKLYSFLSGYGNTVYQSYIQEWLSQFSIPFNYFQLLYLSLVVLSLIFYLFYAISKHKYFTVNLWKVFLVVFFVILSFKSHRHFPLMFIATFSFLIEVYGVILGDALDYCLNNVLKFFLIFCLFLSSISQLLRIDIVRDPFLSFCDNYPCKAVSFLKSNPEYYSKKLFNDYNWGGYFIWADPKRLIFIDGRLPQVKLAEHTYLEEYLDFFKKDVDIREKLNKYQISLIVIPVTDKAVKLSRLEKIVFRIRDDELLGRNYLREYLESSSGWSKIYKDNVSVIYEKK